MRALMRALCRITLAATYQLYDGLTDHPDLDEPLPDNYPPRRLRPRQETP